MKYKLEIMARLLLIILLGCSIMILDKSLLFGIGCIGWCLYWLYQIKPKILKSNFTLLELVAVIAILAILGSITLSLKTDTVKADAMQLKSLLTQVQIYSYENYDEIIKIELDHQFYNEVSINKDVYLKSGVPVDQYGYVLTDVKYTISDSHGSQEDIILYIKSYTGKITFYY